MSAKKSRRNATLFLLLLHDSMGGKSCRCRCRIRDILEEIADSGVSASRTLSSCFMHAPAERWMLRMTMQSTRKRIEVLAVDNIIGDVHHIILVRDDKIVIENFRIDNRFVCHSNYSLSKNK